MVLSVEKILLVLFWASGCLTASGSVLCLSLGSGLMGAGGGHFCVGDSCLEPTAVSRGHVLWAQQCGWAVRVCVQAEVLSLSMTLLAPVAARRNPPPFVGVHHRTAA